MITNGVNYSELNTDIYYLSSYWVNIAIILAMLTQRDGVSNESCSYII